MPISQIETEALVPPSAQIVRDPEIRIHHMTNIETKSVGICDTQPIAAEGVRALLEVSTELSFRGSVETLGQAGILACGGVDILIIDKGFGMHAVTEFLGALKGETRKAAVVVWGVSITESEALRLLQSGAKAIIRKTSEVRNLLACLQAVAEGRTWMENRVFRDSLRAGYPRSELTAREHQVMNLVEQGFKNREIAEQLGIKPGTVKIHLKHIFEKTGVHGRYGLALSGLKDKGLVSLAS